MLILVALLIGVLTGCLNYLWNRRFLYYYSFKINGPLSFPFLGSTYIFYTAKKDNAQFLADAFLKYGDLFKVWLGSNLLIFANNPNDVQVVVESLLEKDAGYQFGNDLIGEGIFNAQYHKWRRNRKPIAALFNTKKLNSFFNTMVKHSKLLVDGFESTLPNDNIDLFPIIQNFTIELIAEILTGTKKVNKNYGYWIIRSETLLMLRFFLIYLHPNIIWKYTRRCKEVNYLTKNTWKFVKQIVESKKQASAINKTNENANETTNIKTFLDYLRESPRQFTSEELNEEIQTLLVAGSGTTSTADATVLLMLALHQDIQRKVLNELDEVFKDSDRELTIEDLGQMKYLEQVIKETLRLFPATPAFARSVDKDIQLNNKIIPKGASIIIPIISVHRNAKFWNDPLKFDPERFNADVIKKHTHAYIPFGGGPRNCIGIRYAMMSMKIMLVTVLRRFEIVSSQYKSVEDIPLHFKIVTKFPKKHVLKLKLRK